MPQAQLYLFGSPRLEAGGFRVEAFPTKRSAYLLALVSLSDRRRLTRREIATTLWPDEPYEATGPRLRQELTRLRKSLGDHSQVVESDLTYIALRDVATDVESFDARLREAKMASGPARERFLRQAIEISREPLLEGGLEDWIVEERRKVANHRYAALLELAEMLVARSDIDEAVHFAEQAAKLMPHREDAHQLSIQALKKSGRVEGALGRVQNLRRFASDSGRAKLLTLAEDLADEVHRTDTGSASPIRAIFGRDAESEKLRAWLDPDVGKARLVTLLGPGGVGKTHLLSETCRGMTRPFNGQVALVDLSEIDQARLVPDAILGALDLGYVPSSDPISQLERAFPSKPFLLGLDNLEQFGSTISALIAKLLRANPSLRILASSRNALNLQEEFRLPLSPLEVPAESENLDQARRSPSVRLLVDIAESSGAELSDDTDWTSIFRIVRKLEGMPLGIRLAASRLRTQPPRELLELLENDPHRVVADEENVPERHRSLKNAVAGSFDLLPIDLRRAAADLSVFRGGWTNEGASQVCGYDDPPRIMAALLDASLLERVTESGQLRFRMLEAVREHAATLLSAERAAVLRRRHLAWALGQTGQWEGRPVDEQTLTMFTAVERETDNLREAMRYAMSVDPDAAFQLAGNLGPFWFYRTSSFEANEVYTELFDRFADRPPSKAMLLAALGQSWAVHLLFFPGKPEIYRRGIEIGRALGDRTYEASFLALQGLYAQNAIQYELCEETIREIDRVSAECGSGDAEGTILRLKGLVALYKGEVSQAIDYYRQSVRWFRSRGEVFGYASSRLHLVLAALENGDPDLAEATIEGLLDDIQRIRFDAMLPAVHSMQGSLHAERGRFEEAVASFSIARELWDRHGASFRAGHQLYDMGRARFDQSRYSDAFRHFLDAAKCWDESGFGFATAIALVGVSGCLWKHGEQERARKIMAACQRQFSISQARIVESQRRFEESILAEMGDFESGDLTLEEAISMAASTNILPYG